MRTRSRCGVRFSVLVAIFTALGWTAAVPAEAPKPAKAEPFQVSVEVRMIQMTRQMAHDLFKPEPTLGRTTVVKEEVLRKLVELEAQKKVTVLCQPKLTTISGNTAQVKSVEEIRYPTDFQIQPIETSSNAPSHGTSAQGVVIIPGGFETREVGTLLNVTPTVAPDGTTINLTLVPELSTMVPGGTKVETKVEFTPSTGQGLVFELPRFRSRQITTTVVVRSGTTVLLGVSDLIEGEDKNQVILMLLTAKIDKAE